MKKILFTLCTICLLARPGYAVNSFGLKNLYVHGFLSLGFLQSNENDLYFSKTEEGTMEFNEMALTFSTSVSDNLRIGMQLLSRDLGKIGNNEVGVDWAYADYNFRNWLGLRVGKLKKPLALFNQYRDVDSGRVSIFLPPGIYHENNRDTTLSSRGVGLYGTLWGGIEYQLNYGMDEVPKDSGTAVYMQERMLARGVDVDINAVDSVQVYAAWLKWNIPFTGLAIGASMNSFDFTIDAATIINLPASLILDTDNELVYFDVKLPLKIKTKGQLTRMFAQYQRDNLMIAAEYGFVDGDLEYPGADYDARSADFMDWFVMATYRFNFYLEAGIYYSEKYENTDDMEGDSYVEEGKPKELAWLKDWTVSLRFDISMNWIFKMETHFINGLHLVNYGDEADPSATSQLYVTKLTYTF